MTSRGKLETEKLKQNLEDQLDRLVAQLADLEDSRDEMVIEEFDELKNETLEQLKEFSLSLNKLMAGNITLVDDLNAMQLATQAAISNAFRTPEVIRLFARKQPHELRQKLTDVERDAKAGKLTQELATQQKIEILLALKTLGEQLSPTELHCLQSQSIGSLKEYELISEDLTSSQKVLELAGSQVNNVSS